MFTKKGDMPRGIERGSLFYVGIAHLHFVPNVTLIFEVCVVEF